MRFQKLCIAVSIGVILLSFAVPLVQASGLSAGRAQATQPSGPQVQVPDQVNLRSGPGTGYDLVGVLVKGQEAKALGRSSGGDWIQIEYIGVPEKVAWVYSPLVNLTVPITSLQIVEPPPTPTQAPFPTLDPVIALSLVAPQNGPTRLPTFTPAPPVAQPTLLPVQGLPTEGGFPPAIAIIALFVVGLFGVVVSFLRAAR